MCIYYSNKKYVLTVSIDNWFIKKDIIEYHKIRKKIKNGRVQKK